MPGWREEANNEDIESFAQHVANNDGKRVYSEAYAAACKLKAAGKSLDEVRKAIVCEPQEPPSGNEAMNHRKSHAASKQLAGIRRQAVEDALENRPPCFKG